MLNGGGGVYWQGNLPKLDSSLIFKDNQASYGRDKASNGQRLRLSGNSSKIFRVISKISGMISGQKIEENLGFEHIDFYGQVITNEENFKCKISIR